MSRKHNRWAWLKPRSLLDVQLLLMLVSTLFAGPQFRKNRRGAQGMEGVGFGLAVVGGFVAVATLVGVFFIPVATFPTVDQEVGALVGVILLIVGLAMRAAD